LALPTTATVTKQSNSPHHDEDDDFKKHQQFSIVGVAVRHWDFFAVFRITMNSPNKTGEGIKTGSGEDVEG
jgi:hypothetical protein